MPDTRRRKGQHSGGEYDGRAKESLEAALERANAGLATEDLADAKTEAIKTQALLDSLK